MLITYLTDTPVDPSGPVALNDTLASVRLSAGTVTFLIATVLPILVGLASKLASRYKGPLLLILTAVTAMIVNARLGDGTAVLSQQTLEVFIKGLIGAFGSYYGLLRPNGITSSAVAIPGDTPGSTKMVPGKLATKGIK